MSEVAKGGTADDGRKNATGARIADIRCVDHEGILEHPRTFSLSASHRLGDDRPGGANALTLEWLAGELFRRRHYA